MSSDDSYPAPNRVTPSGYPGRPPLAGAFLGHSVLGSATGMALGATSAASSSVEQGGAAHHHDDPGSGLGLAIVREVAPLHGGTEFAAARPGGGALVGFTLEPGGAGDPP